MWSNEAFDGTIVEVRKGSCEGEYFVSSWRGPTFGKGRQKTRARGSRKNVYNFGVIRSAPRRSSS